MWYNILAVAIIMGLVIIWIAVNAAEKPDDEADPDVNIEDDSEDDLNKN